MAMIEDIYVWGENAGIEVSDKTKVQSARITYKKTAAGDVATFHFEMKPGVVTFPPGLQSFDGNLIMEV